jgi:two-component system phosphate regulon sensor histidine kinase PhoR
MTKVFVFLAVGVMLPVLLSSSVGIVSLVQGENSSQLVIGILSLCFAAATLGGAVTVTVLLGSRARRARLRDDLTANVSHELRTPLSSIRMYAQTLLAGTLDDDPARTRESLEIIVRESQWLEAMIDRVLVWRSANQDRSSLHQECKSLGPAVEETAERFTRMIAPEGTEFSTSIETRVAVLHEPKAVSAAVLNLLINAYKHCPAPRRIRLEVEDKAGEVFIRVQDNGPGIPPSQRKKIFAAFYQVEQAHGSHKGGLGLGLAIVEQLASSHKGRVSIDDAPEGGACFTIVLPAAPPEEPTS